MNQTYFRYLFRPVLRRPVLVEGVPGFGNVGRLAAELFIRLTNAKPFAEMYSPLFPDYVTVDMNGICHPPCYRFYASSLGGSDFIILTGDAQPPQEDVVAHYGLCGDILDFAEGFGCRFVATMDGVPSPNPEGKIYVAATSPKLALEVSKRGAAIYGGRRLVGVKGLLLGLAKQRGWRGVCLLGATTGVGVDRRAAFSVFKLLLRVMDLEEA